MQKNKGRKNKRGSSYKHDYAYMRAVVQEYESSDLSGAQIGRKYGIAAYQVHRWKKLFSSELSQSQILALPMNPQEQQQLDALKKQNEELVKRLEQANLKIAGLETLIDIAEQELQLDIRKKSGTKQSSG